MADLSGDEFDTMAATLLAPYEESMAAHALLAYERANLQDDIADALRKASRGAFARKEPSK